MAKRKNLKRSASRPAKPGLAKAESARSKLSKPRPSKPGSSKPGSSKPGSSKPGSSKLSLSKPSLLKPSLSKSGLPKSGPGKRPLRSPRPWTAAEIEEAFSRFARANPEPRGELQYTNPYTLLVAVVLSAQATDTGVNKATPALFAAAATPQQMVALGEARVRDYVRTIGLYRTKAKNVIALSAKLIAKHGGEVPRSREALESLPGVGRKTANVVMNIAFGEPTIAVDTHLFRVSNRTGLAPGKTPLAVELGLLARIPARFMLHAHHWLILHGRYVCKARVPDCPACIVSDLCRWPEKLV